MIIECPNCNKKFNVEADLIPDKGRKIKCGSCTYSWFYKIEKAPLDNSNIYKNDNKLEAIIESDKNENNEIIKDRKKIIIPVEEIKVSHDKDHTKTNNISNIFSYLLVFIISLVALIILLDTFKTLLFNFFPHLEIILFNLYETLKDIKLFIIDLT